MKTDEQASSQMENQQEENEFEAVKARLEEIADAVSNEDLSLDDALDLYEEAVSLGLQASDLLEVGVTVDDAEDDAQQAEATQDGEGSVDGRSGEAAPDGAAE